MGSVELGGTGFPNRDDVIEGWVDFRVTRIVVYGYIQLRGCSQLTLPF